MSKRERWLAVLVLGLIGFFAVDRLLISPVVAAFQQRAEEKARLTTALSDGQLLVRNRRPIEDRWHAFLAAGLADPVEVARLRVQTQLSAWSQVAGLSLDTLATGRVVAGERFDELGFTVSGSGSLQAVRHFLQALAAADFPLRVLSCDLTSRSESEDRLSLMLRLSTRVDPDADLLALARAEVVPWQPPVIAAEVFQPVVAMNIFRSDRAALLVAATPKDPEPVVRPPVTDPTPPPNPDADWVLSGIAHHGDLAVAFLEEPRTARVVRVEPGGAVASGRIVTIRVAEVVYEAAGEEQVVAVGQTLTGQMASGVMVRGSADAPRESGGGRGQVAGEAGAGDRAAELMRRMRERRNQE